MLISSVLIAILPILATATHADDMQNLMTTCENTAIIINDSLNNSAALNTSDLVQSIVWQLGASLANLEAQNPSANSSQAGNSSESLDSPYFNYIDSVIDVSEALLRRGQATHQEQNQPVFNTIQSLASVVQSYGFQLGDQISRSATIRTLTAGDSLVDAESVWANPGSSSG